MYLLTAARNLANLCNTHWLPPGAHAQNQSRACGCPSVLLRGLRPKLNARQNRGAIFRPHHPWQKRLRARQAKQKDSPQRELTQIDFQ